MCWLDEVCQWLTAWWPCRLLIARYAAIFTATSAAAAAGAELSTHHGMSQITPPLSNVEMWLEFWVRRMASAEGGSVPSGLWYGEGCPLSSLLGGLGSVVSSTSGVRGTDFWRILKATERSFLYLYDKNLRGTIYISVPYSKFWGTCSPRPP